MSKEVMRKALEKIANVNAMDYEYQAWAREALASEAKKPDFWEGYVPEPVKCKYPKCSYPCTDLPDCRDAEQPAQQALDKMAENARELGLDYEPAQQEPVAWPCLIAEADFAEDTVTLAMQCTDYKVSAGKHWLSNTPPAQRTWVGLSDEEADELVQRFARYELLRAIETTLRSKNEDRS